MTATLSLKEFCRRLVESSLMSPDEILAFRAKFARDQLPTTAEAMARELVLRNRLTGFQARRILDGRHLELVLGNNVLLAKIGEGGMGEVFRAEHRRMKRMVCVKILRRTLTGSHSAIRRFQREAQTAAQLTHPNIVTAYDADESQGVFFLVMELVEGRDLGTIVTKHGPLFISEALDYLTQAARGLEYAHTKGVIHRDIKPGNLLLDRSGTIKILDLGLARFEEQAELVSGDEEHLTRENQIIGTVEYMAPEQAENSGNVDRRSDIYSLGCTLYRLLTGKAPYQAESPLNVLMAHRVRPIPSLRELRPDVPVEVDAIFQRMVAKDPDERFQSMTELLEALGQLQVSDLDDRRHSMADLTSDDATAPTKTLSLERKPTRDSTAELRPLEMTLPELGSTGSRISTDGRIGSTTRAYRPPVVGIDLGTTYSAIAVLDDLGRPRVLPNWEGDVLTPSVLLIDGDEVVVGREAVKAMSVTAEQVATGVKLELGKSTFGKQLDGREFRPEVLEAYLLRRLRQDVSRVLGDVRKVVITVPAYFDETRRKATQDAGYMAGFEVLDLINEPTAAVLAFAFQRGHFDAEQSARDSEQVLVYDLGGGTFDVTVVEIRGRELITRATAGDVRLGGRDWDQRLIDYVAEQFVRSHAIDPREDERTLGRLMRECEEAKRTLTTRKKTHVVCDYRGDSLRVEVSRELFEELTADLLERTAALTEQTLQEAGLTWQQLDHLLPVGGATRMPAVDALLRQRSGREPDLSVAPDEIVAQGAALHAGMLLDRYDGITPRFAIHNVNAHSLGIVGAHRRTGRPTSAVLIPRNTPLPAAARRVFRTQKKGQTSLHVRLVEGESRRPDECVEIGRCKIRGLPPDLPARTKIEVEFAYAENGRITVAVQVPGQSETIKQEIARAHSMTQEELDCWRAQLG